MGQRVRLPDAREVPAYLPDAAFDTEQRPCTLRRDLPPLLLELDGWTLLGG